MRTIGNTFEGEGPKSGKKLRSDWIAEAGELGIEVPSKATVEDIKGLIAAASAGGEGKEAGTPEDGGEGSRPEEGE